ncbi:hypothetical protein ABHN11_00035 [Brevibacillus centrosporus]|uniref:hypothetical protein n=1 Tax=Brevibacillus centrosporus TaxID=54910 RepID=UPI003D1FF4DB
MFILLPCSDKGEPVSNSPVLLIASSPTEKKLMPLSVQQAELALDMLYDVVKENDDVSEFLDVNALLEARTSLRDIQNWLEPVVNLTEKLSVVLTRSTVPVTLWEIQLEISGISMIPMCFEFIGFEGSNDNISTTFRLEDIPKDHVKTLRLLDDVLLFIDLGNGKEHEYTGKCTRLEVHDDLLVMTIQSFAYDLSKTRMGHLSTIGFSPLDLIHLIGREGGFDEKNIIIQGFSPDHKTYTVTAPILNMKLTESLGFGNIMFYPAGYFPAEAARIREVANNSSEVFESNTLAVVHVESNTPYDAFKIGIDQIEQVLDVILHIVRADTVFKGVVTDTILGSWDINNLTPHPVVSTWVHVEEPFGGGRLIMDTSRIEQPDTLTIRTDTQHVLEQMEWYELLIRKLEETGDEGLKSLFSALKWLRRSWDAEDPEDKIIFANIALEFVASGEPSPPVIPKEFTKLVRKAAVDKFKELFQGEDKDEYVKKLSQKIADALNSAPLRIQVEGLVERNRIPISQADMVLIFEGRKIRNDLVHGRSVKQTFTKIQNRKMVNGIGILVSHKLRSFCKEDSQ